MFLGAEDGAEALVEWGGCGMFCAWEFAEEGAVGGARLVGEGGCHFGGEGWRFGVMGVDDLGSCSFGFGWR